MGEGRLIEVGPWAMWIEDGRMAMCCRRCKRPFRGAYVPVTLCKGLELVCGECLAKECESAGVWKEGRERG